MSTLTGEENSSLIQSESDLANYFQSFAKCDTCMRVGLEAEFFAVSAKTGQALPYEGPGGIHEILKRMASKAGYEPVFDGENIIALKKGDNQITLEPGGQMELSAPPVFSIFEIRDQLETFLRELQAVQKDFPGTAWLACGFHPVSNLEDITWVPKRRYALMADYLPKRGKLAHAMMKQTATNQLNVDYKNEEDAMSLLRTGLAISPLVSAMFANSPFTAGKPNGYQTYRMEVWNHMDPDRSGLITQFLQPGKKFSDYMDYLLDMPMMFIVRRNQWIPLNGLTFRRYIREGFEGSRATLGDFELHLSAAFPEVRIKQYVEVRGADCQTPDRISAVAAFWKGILYDDFYRNQAWKQVSFASEKDFKELYAAMPKLGLKAKLAGKPILPIVRELVELSCAGLAKQKRVAAGNECIFLTSFFDQFTRPGKTPADLWLESWEAKGRSLNALLEPVQIL